MNRSLPLLALLIAPLLGDDNPPDLLRLTNGEMEGQFGGINNDGVLRWEREDGIAPMEFRTDKIKQVVLRGGTGLKADQDTAHVFLVNGDRLPGRVISLDAETITVETPIGGTLNIARNAAHTIAPSPFGGRLIYAGPFSTDEWHIGSRITEDEKVEKNKPAADEADEAENDDGNDAEGKKPKATEEVAEEEKTEEPPAHWRHIGSKWYNTGGNDPLTLDVGLPDQSIYRFTVEWRAKPPMAIGFHADFAGPPPPEPKEDGEEKPDPKRIIRHSSNQYAKTFGNALVLSMRSSYVQLYRCGYDEDGQPFSDQIRSSSTTVRFDDSGKAEFELRTDRKGGITTLFINGEYSMQWKIRLPEDEEELKLGSGIGFQVLDDDTPVRISDIVVAEWNGMPDSARSLDSNEFDVVLLNNGTDRFSGKVISVEETTLTLRGQYAELKIPMGEIAEIRFAGSSLAEPEKTKDNEVSIHFQPVGQLTGTPGLTKDGKMKLNSPILGKLDVDLESAVILEFQSGNSFLNYWDEDL